MHHENLDFDHGLLKLHPVGPFLSVLDRPITSFPIHMNRHLTSDSLIGIIEFLSYCPSIIITQHLFLCKAKSPSIYVYVPSLLLAQGQINWYLLLFCRLVIIRWVWIFSSQTLHHTLYFVNDKYLFNACNQPLSYIHRHTLRSNWNTHPKPLIFKSQVVLDGEASAAVELDCLKNDSIRRHSKRLMFSSQILNYHL
jgi:hypothetical protein